MILGVGPTPDGEFTFEETQRLEEIGHWLALYGEGIYETRARPTAWTNEWYLTYQKDGKAHFAFRSIAAVACEQIPLTEIGATEEDKLIDLATKNRYQSIKMRMNRISYGRISVTRTLGQLGFAFRHIGKNYTLI